jgi:kynureninase
MTDGFRIDEAYAASLDAADPLGRFRERFYVPEGTIYLDGNSLGLLSVDAEESVKWALESWKRQVVRGWTEADPAWFTLGEDLAARMAFLFGASPESVIVTGTTTVNLHQMVGTFYRPSGARRKIVATALDFPSDIYALQSQILLQGGNLERDLVLVPSADGRIVEEDDIIAAITNDVALVLLPSVLYRSGQLLDIPRLVRAAHERGAIIGFDCAHSAGAVQHEFEAWNVDFAVWCTYKYLNAGPGAVGALFVHPRHFGTVPSLAGWWGYRKERQFEMVHTWEGAPHAGAFQISTLPLLSTAPLIGSMRIIGEAGIDRIRQKSLELTDYLIDLTRAMGLEDERYGFAIGTPIDHERRGGHVALEHPEAVAISRALIDRGVVVDLRKPIVIRLTPVPLYSRFGELWRALHILAEIVTSGAHLGQAEATRLVT